MTAPETRSTPIFFPDAALARIDLLSDVAWPAAEQVPLGPWKLRATQGVSRRTNSVLTVPDASSAAAGAAAGQAMRAAAAAGGEGPAPPHDLDARIDAAEWFYRERSLTPAFYLSAFTDPPGLDDLLARRGYVLSGATEVWTLDVAPSTGGGRANDAGAARDGPAGAERVRADAPSADWVYADAPPAGWFDCAFDEPPGKRAVHEAIVLRTPAPRRFAAAVVDGVAAACGMAVATADHAGIFCMATRPDFRRRGLARRLLLGLIDWARGTGALRVYLQVMCENAGAQALYAGVGFRRAYGYHYRMRFE